MSSSGVGLVLERSDQTNPLQLMEAELSGKARRLSMRSGAPGELQRVCLARSDKPAQPPGRRSGAILPAWPLQLNHAKHDKYYEKHRPASGSRPEVSFVKLWISKV